MCQDVDAARAAGHPDVVAPPTFTVTFTMPAIEAFLRDPAFGWDYSRMVHAEQSITLHRPIHGGDELVTTIHVEDLRTRGRQPLADPALRDRRRRRRRRWPPRRLLLVTAAEADAVVTARRGRAAAAAVRVTRADLVRYAGASGDFNPIHWSDRVATVGRACPA